ncbi:MAG: TRAP transporter small permease subunit [Betaproteobacteria bacterium]|nr:TRAP transporter small permease subunit [Betaproteobacteria bacterium]MBV9361991.1 TRAP transporter small permease subunit [Betaproteobacteria bacterium]
MLPTLERLTVAATRALSVVGLIALMGLAAMTLADGLLRWLLNRPIEGVRDLGGLAIAVAIASCLPVVLSERGNIAIRLGASVHPLLGRVLDALAALAVAAILAAVAWQIWIYAAKLGHARETTFVLQIPVAPFWYGVDVILWFAVVVQLVVAARDWANMFKR